MERPTFSPSWSRVNRLTPSLRAQVQVRRRVLRGQPWYVLHDPLGNQFSRLNPVAYHFVGLLDGHRTVEEAWQMTLQRHGDHAPTQHEVIALLGQLNQGNLLKMDLPADAEPLMQRHRRKRIKHWAGQAMSVLFVQIPVFNPHTLLVWLLPFFRPLLTKWGLALWVIWLTFCGAVFFPNAGPFIRESTDLLSSPSNWGYLILMFIALKAIHELGHGLMCLRFGGPVYEAGIMLLVLVPSPYMDTSSSWGFDSKWKRLLVGAAGMMFELTIAGAAALLWVHADNVLVKQLAHHVVLLASIATILFNANALMRFDGYFMLSDLLEIPNLYERASRQLKYLFQKYLYRLPSAQPVTADRSERWVLLVYGIAALIYRVLVMFAIALFISGKLFTLGLALAIWTVGSWLIFPVLKFIRWLAVGGDLHKKRQRTIAITAAVAAALLLTFGWVPWPQHRRAMGVVEAAERAELIVQTDGFVTAVHAEPGDFVQAGQLIIEADNPVLRAHRRGLRADLDATRVALLNALKDSPADQHAAHARIAAYTEELTQIDQRLEELNIRSPMAGQLVAPPMQPLVGRYLKPGQQLATVIDPQTLRVTALVDQAANSLVALEGVERVELRARGQANHTVKSKLIKAFDSGRRTLPHPALGTAGGGAIAMDADDPDQQSTLRPQFYLWLDLPESSNAFELGQRVHVRFTLSEPKPLIAQFYHRLRQTFNPGAAL